MVVIRCSRSWRARSRKSETLKLTNKRKKKKKKEGEKRGVGKLKGGWRKFRRVMAFKCETVLCRSVVLQISPVICVKRYARSIHRAKKEFHPFFFIFPSFFRSFPFYSFSLFFSFVLLVLEGGLKRVNRANIITRYHWLRYFQSIE